MNEGKTAINNIKSTTGTHAHLHKLTLAHRLTEMRIRMRIQCLIGIRTCRKQVKQKIA